MDLPNWVGDHMMTMPAVHRLLQGNRGGTTVLHSRPNMLRFLSAIFPETRVVSSPHKAWPFSSARRLREEGRRFDIGVTLRNSARAKIFVRLVADWSAGSLGEGARVLLSAPCLVDRSRHQIHDADAILAALGLEAVDSFWRGVLPADLMGEGALMIRGAGLDRHNLIGLAPATARGVAKRWPGRRYGELARRLRALGYQPVVVIGPGENEIAEEMSEAAGVDLPVLGRRTDVAGLAAVIAGIRVLVANDSGPMQVAASLGVPVVAIFGPTDPGRTAPVGSRHRVVSPPPGHGGGIQGVSIDQVEAATLDLFERSAGDVCGRF